MSSVGRYSVLFAVSVAMTVGIFTVSFFVLPKAHADTLTPEQRAQLQAQYDQLQQEIATYQKVIDDTRAKEASLQGDVTSLNAAISKAQAEIKQRTNVITQLGDQITQKAAVVQTLQEKLQDSKDSLGKLMRERQQAESTSLVELALASGTLSDFFSTMTTIDSLNGALQNHMNELLGIKTETQAQQDQLAAQQDQQLDAKHDAQVLQQTVSNAKAQKAQELTVTKGQESAYNKVLAQKQAQATQIRNALFNLRDAQGITFETALQYAQDAEAKTGVRAAFILGILRQESNLGTNVGQCLLTDATTGAGKGKNTGTPFAKVMHPTRDVPVFMDITQRLGIDPYSQVVSCPQSVGYGGAMGPSQFIPSTWKSYENRIEVATGSAVADPWKAGDAIMATALYMKDLGAGAQTYSAERKAAAQYYAGSNWATLGISYANSVLSFADQYQQNINFLKDNNL
ncbi:MAG TPA: lytic murein transglycosylase [Candidatus Paceibacterota bacterium]|nr:lytic murein transglycosylase [Candidatus Paceibacterota bacterium]